MDDLRAVMASFEAQGADGADEPRARKRRRIVEAATARFLRHGYRKTSLDDVAADAGIAKGTIYLYFKNKAELLFAVVLAEKMTYLERIQPIFEPALDGRERLRRYLVLALELAAEMPLTSKLLAGDREVLAALAEMEPAQMRQSVELGIEFIADLVGGAAGGSLPAAEVREKAQAITGLLLAVTMADDRGRFGLPLPRFAATLADLIVDGVGRAAKGPPAPRARVKVPVKVKEKSRSRSR